MQQYYAINSSPDEECWQSALGERWSSHKELLSNGRCRRNTPLLLENRHMDRCLHDRFSPCDGKIVNFRHGSAINCRYTIHKTAAYWQQQHSQPYTVYVNEVRICVLKNWIKQCAPKSRQNFKSRINHSHFPSFSLIFLRFLYTIWFNLPLV